MFFAPASDSAPALTGWPPELFVSPEIPRDYCPRDLLFGFEPNSLHPVLSHRDGIQPPLEKHSDEVLSKRGSLLATTTAILRKKHSKACCDAQCSKGLGNHPDNASACLTRPLIPYRPSIKSRAQPLNVASPQLRDRSELTHKSPNSTCPSPAVLRPKRLLGLEGHDPACNSLKMGATNPTA